MIYREVWNVSCLSPVTGFKMVLEVQNGCNNVKVSNSDDINSNDISTINIVCTKSWWCALVVNCGLFTTNP